MDIIVVTRKLDEQRDDYVYFSGSARVGEYEWDFDSLENYDIWQCVESIFPKKPTEELREIVRELRALGYP